MSNNVYANQSDDLERRRLVAAGVQCGHCGKEIDPDTCGCGDSRENHDSWSAGHSFVPAGCDCGRESP